MNLLDPSTLLTGGAIAMVAGFWSQTKNLLRQMSAIFIVQGKLQSDLVFCTRTYLKRHFKVVPSGLRYYAAHTVRIPGRSRYVTIPFRLIEGTMIFYRKWELVVFYGEKLLAIRGMCNMDRLVADAIDDDEHYAEIRDSKDTRFYIYQIVGTEKSMFGGIDRNNSKGASAIGNSDAPVPDSSSSHTYLDVNIDRSFRHPPEYYLRDDRIDPFQSLYFNDDVMAHIENAKQWRRMGDWYAERDIPWRRGWALKGPGGTGKSSLARAIAEVMKIPIYDFKLNTLSDQEFLNAWKDMSVPCVALFEDFDNVFHGRKSLTEHQSLSFDTILNVISGINSFSGVFLIITTNHLENIDPAMGVSSEHDNGVSTRPGRIDTVIHLGTMDIRNKRKMAHRILKDWPDTIEDVVNQEKDATPAQFQELCLKIAFEKIHNEH